MATRLPILTFHALDESSSNISISPRVFRYGIAMLYEHEYRTVTLVEVVDALRRGASLPERSFAITFDDGHQSVYDQAFSVLKRYGMSATVFLTVGDQGTAKRDRLPSLSGQPMLSWQEIQEMHEYGIGFGANSLTHPDLNEVSLERMKAEVRNSKAIIEEILNTSVASFAYPYGRYDQSSRAYVSQHFACACSDYLGLITAHSDCYALQRVDAYYLRTERLFQVMITQWFPWYIRARAVPRRIRRAILRKSA